MSTLIPLMLGTNNTTGSRSSVVFSDPLPISRISQRGTSHTRKISVELSPLSRPPNAPMRLPPPVPKELPILPYSPAEWKRTISEVKRQYTNRKYRSCLARCTDVLDNMRNPDAEPAHLIFLRFYAACCAEMLAKPLNPSSPYRSKLLYQARDNYVRARDLTRTAEETISALSRPSSAATTNHSFRSSCSSLVSCAYTDITSPSESLFSLENTFTALVKDSASRTKHVSFAVEPFTRPDSPTLGLDDINSRPSSPQLQNVPFLQDALKSLSVEAILALPTPARPAPSPPVLQTALFPSLVVEEEMDDFWSDREAAICRYRDILSSLRFQADAHLAALDTQVNVLPAAAARLSFSMPTRPAAAAGLDMSDEMRGIAIKARIERLRAVGWQSKRFDVKRYEDLRESVLAELHQ